MADLKTRLTHRNGKWQIMVRKGANGVAGMTWVSLGGCPCQLTAMRVWLACHATDKR
jgi:hypothetical protein